MTLTRVMTLVGGRTRSREREVVLSRGLMDGPCEDTTPRLAGCKPAPIRIHGSRFTAADPLLFRDLGRSASLYRPFPPNARPHPLLQPCFLRAPLSQLRRKWLRFQPKNFPFFGKSKLDHGTRYPASLTLCLILELEDFSK